MVVLLVFGNKLKHAFLFKVPFPPENLDQFGIVSGNIIELWLLFSWYYCNQGLNPVLFIMKLCKMKCLLNWKFGLLNWIFGFFLYYSSNQYKLGKIIYFTHELLLAQRVVLYYLHSRIWESITILKENLKQIRSYGSKFYGGHLQVSFKK